MSGRVPALPLTGPCRPRQRGGCSSRRAATSSERSRPGFGGRCRRPGRDRFRRQAAARGARQALAPEPVAGGRSRANLLRNYTYADRRLCWPPRQPCYRRRARPRWREPLRSPRAPSARVATLLAAGFRREQNPPSWLAPDRTRRPVFRESGREDQHLVVRFLWLLERRTSCLAPTDASVTPTAKSTKSGRVTGPAGVASTGSASASGSVTTPAGRGNEPRTTHISSSLSPT
jgi:hypothetical protein